MKRVWIVGGSSFAREVYAWLIDAYRSEPDWEFAGFLSDIEADAKGVLHYPPGLTGTIREFQPQADDWLVMGIGSPTAKQKVAELLLARGAQFLTVIHPTAVIGPHVRLGQGVVVCPQVVLTCDITVGDLAMFNLAATVGHDARIGDYSTLSPHADVNGNGHLGKAVFLGSHACVIPKGEVGDYATVGAGSLVTKPVEAGTTVVGVPARPLRKSEPHV